MTAHILISGMVHGVGFRFFIRSNALKLNLTGWVANTDDGKVEALLQGSKENIDEMIKICHQGPMLAKVRSIDAKTLEGASDFSTFEIVK